MATAAGYINRGSWLVILGWDFSDVLGTIPANNVGAFMQVQDPAGQAIDTIAIIGENYVAAPASGGGLLTVGLPRKMLVPPGGSVKMANASGAAVASTVSVCVCASLEDALMIL